MERSPCRWSELPARAGCISDCCAEISPGSVLPPEPLPGAPLPESCSLFGVGALAANWRLSSTPWRVSLLLVIRRRVSRHCVVRRSSRWRQHFIGLPATFKFRIHYRSPASREQCRRDFWRRSGGCFVGLGYGRGWLGHFGPNFCLWPLCFVRILGSTMRGLRRRGLRGRLRRDLGQRRCFLDRLLPLEPRNFRGLLQIALVHVDSNHCGGRHSCCRSQSKSPSSPPCSGRTTMCRGAATSAPASLARQGNHLPASAAHRQVLEYLAAFLRAESLLGKRAEHFGVGMILVMFGRTHGAACSLNASLCEFCRICFRFICRSRGSAPRVSSAARRLSPSRRRFLSTCFRVSSVARRSLRLTVASCTPKHARNLQQGLPVKIICRQQEPFLGIPLLEGLLDGALQLRKLVARRLRQRIC